MLGNVFLQIPSHVQWFTARRRQLICRTYQQRKMQFKELQLTSQYSLVTANHSSNFHLFCPCIFLFLYQAVIILPFKVINNFHKMDFCADSTIPSANIWSLQLWQQLLDGYCLMDPDVQLHLSRAPLTGGTKYLSQYSLSTKVLLEDAINCSRS